MIKSTKMRRKWNVARMKYVRNSTRIFIGETEGNSQHGGLGVEKRILKKYSVRCEAESPGSGSKPMVGSCIYGYKFSIFINST
jgi:hypothetical protein